MDFRIFTEPQQGASYADLLAMAQASEQLGFDGFFRSDHYLGMGTAGLPGPTDAWTTLAGLARETSRLRLGTLVSSVTFRHPAILAIQAAQVDEMSGGRIELGLGTGWFEAEHTALGIPFPSKRFGHLEEQLEIISGLWSTPVGDTFSFEGSHYRLQDAPGLPKPAQSPLPIIVGGTGPTRTPALAARYAAEFNIAFKDEATIGNRFAAVRDAAGAIGRDPDSIVYSAALTCAVGRNEADYRRRAEAIGRDPDSFRRHNIAGTASEAVDTIGRLRELGADRVYLQILDLHDLEHLAFIAGEVLTRI
jgi:F420-dependent oxidoreductase-like protein